MFDYRAYRPSKMSTLAYCDRHNGQDSDFTLSWPAAVLARQQLRPAPRCHDGKWRDVIKPTIPWKCLTDNGYVRLMKRTAAACTSNYFHRRKGRRVNEIASVPAIIFFSNRDLFIIVSGFLSPEIPISKWRRKYSYSLMYIRQNRRSVAANTFLPIIVRIIMNFVTLRNIGIGTEKHRWEINWNVTEKSLHFY